MSNTPCIVRRGVTVYALGTHATKEDGELLASLMAALGLVEKIGERLMSAVTALTAPASVCISEISLCVLGKCMQTGLHCTILLLQSPTVILSTPKLVLYK